jgi:hypothetical protein
MKLVKLLLLLGTLTAFAAAVAAGQPRDPARPVGTIRGVVLDENLRPLAGAQVWEESGDRPQIGMINFVESDTDGRFVLASSFRNIQGVREEGG